MKNKYYFIIVIMICLNITHGTPSFAVKHDIHVGNFYFTPEALNVTVGDTMHWIWDSGTHTTTSLTIPHGAAAWNAPMDASNTSFEYKVTVEGTYNYDCTIHFTTMIASFTAANPPTLLVAPSNRNVTSPAGSTTFSVTSNSSWTASSNQTWCTVTPSGNSNGTITANYTVNPDITQCVATITVTVATLTPQDVTVTQAGSPTLTATANAIPGTIDIGQNSQLDITRSGGTGAYAYAWTSNPVGFTSSLKNPVVNPGSTTIYTCAVTSGSQTVNPSSTVTVNPITVTGPNGGETFTQGSTHDITWIDNISENVMIDLYKGGSFLGQIVASTPSNGIYSWNIPVDQLPGSDYRVSITSTISGSVTDNSNADFAISNLPGSTSSIQDIGIQNGEHECFDATQTINVAGDGTLFNVASGAVVTMIAGQNIDFLPQTIVSSGGYLHAYITTDGQYCGTPSAPNASGQGDQVSGRAASTKIIDNVYPNPTSGEVNLRLNSELVSGEVIVNIFSTFGQLVQAQKFPERSLVGISLSGQPDWMYYCRVISGARTGMVKIVKK